MRHATTEPLNILEQGLDVCEPPCFFVLVLGEKVQILSFRPIGKGEAVGPLVWQGIFCQKDDISIDQVKGLGDMDGPRQDDQDITE